MAGHDPQDFFDRHDRVYTTSTVSTRLPGGERSPRLNNRYRAIVRHHAALFREARVLDIASHDGRWSLAALKAGARHVTGVEGRASLVAHSIATMRHYDVPDAAYSFLQADIFDALGDFAPASFDLILCLGFFYHTMRHHELFQQFHRLRARQVVLDTEIVIGTGPIVRYKRERHEFDSATLPTTAGLSHSLVGVPNAAMITLLSGHFGFSQQLVDWQSLGITDWADTEDYREDRRRTYLLQNIDPTAPEA